MQEKWIYKKKDGEEEAQSLQAMRRAVTQKGQEETLGIKQPTVHESKKEDARWKGLTTHH